MKEGYGTMSEGWQSHWSRHVKTCLRGRDVPKGRGKEEEG